MSESHSTEEPWRGCLTALKLTVMSWSGLPRADVAATFQNLFERFAALKNATNPDEDELTQLIYDSSNPMPWEYHEPVYQSRATKLQQFLCRALRNEADTQK
jgi:hypothetical protein